MFVKKEALPSQMAYIDPWKTMDKIRAATWRVGFNLWDIFKQVDRYEMNIISEQKFISVFLGDLKDIIGLNEKEVLELASYFRVSDGRIHYIQLCKLIHDEAMEGPKPEMQLNESDPLAVNPFSYEDLKRLQMILTKIAVSARQILDNPMIKDPFLLKQDAGIMTKSLFSTILSSHGINLSSEEFILFLRRYAEDTVTIRYQAFLKELTEIVQYFEDHEMYDQSGELRLDFPGRSIVANLPHLPRPEINPTLPSSECGIRKVYSPNWKGNTPPEEIVLILKKLKDHVSKEKIYIGNFYKKHDPFDCGRVTESVFRQGFDKIKDTVMGFNDFYIAPMEVDTLCVLYADPYDPARIFWKQFIDDLYEGIEKRELYKWPAEREKMQFEKIYNEEQRKLEKIERMKEPPKTLERIKSKIKRKVTEKDIDFRIICGKYDRKNLGHIAMRDFEHVLDEAEFLFTNEELNILEERYNDQFGINYKFFIEDIKNTPYCDTKKIREEALKVKAERERHEELKRQKLARESNVVAVLGKIKKKLMQMKVRSVDFFKPYDKEEQQLITRTEFQKGLEDNKVNLTQTEMETLFSVFSLPEDNTMFEYKKLCKNVDNFSELSNFSEIIKQNLEKEIQSKPPFLNFQERQQLSLAMSYLRRHINQHSINTFKEYDPDLTGKVSRNTFLQILHQLGALSQITTNDLDIIVKGFGSRKETNNQLDYILFFKAIEIISHS